MVVDAAERLSIALNLPQAAEMAQEPRALLNGRFGSTTLAWAEVVGHLVDPRPLSAHKDFEQDLVTVGP
jgi:hypothetical protein